MSEKVFWSEAEKHAIVQSAIEIQRKRPDLAGLPLLREAMKTLPANRRRRLVSLSQVEWFEESVKAEARLQAVESKTQVLPTRVVWSEDNPYLPIMREYVEANRQTEASVRRLVELHEDWRATNEPLYAANAALLTEIKETIADIRQTAASHMNDQATICMLLRAAIAEIASLRTLAYKLIGLTDLDARLEDRLCRDHKGPPVTSAQAPP